MKIIQIQGLACSRSLKYKQGSHYLFFMKKYEKVCNFDSKKLRTMLTVSFHIPFVNRVWSITFKILERILART